MSLIRARFCELLAQTHAPAEQAQQAFVTGLFSLLDVLMGEPLDQLLGSIPLTDDIRAALLTRKGKLGFYLRSVKISRKPTGSGSPPTPSGSASTKRRSATSI
jgi:c-di-GMP-related signal transduction protein